jgi:hypothetical protein
MSDVLRIQHASLVQIARALDDRAAVGEHGEFVFLGGEFEEKAVEAYVAAHQPKVTRHLLEIQFRRDSMRDLHGVAAAQAGRLRTLLPFEPFKFLVFAAGAIDFAQERRDLDAAADVFPHIDVDQFAINNVKMAGQNLEALGDLQIGDDADDGREHACGGRLQRRSAGRAFGQG